MVAKSQATAAWDRRNSDQETLERVGAGSNSALLRICQTVDAAMVWPSPAQFAVDAAVAPDWIFGCEAQCESAKLR